jgi:SAM-dependent methyltransferase
VDFDDVFSSPSLSPRSRIERLFYSLNGYTLHGILHSIPTGDGKGKRILDVGCSSAEKLVQFNERGFDVAGVDMARDAIAKANELFGSGFYVGQLADIGFPEGCFDAVRIDNTLEHIDKPLELLREAWRILKPGGTMAVYVPNGESLTVRLLKGLSINSWVPFHVILYSRSTLRRVLKSAGFSRIRILSHTSPALLTSTLSQVIGASQGRLVSFGRYRYLVWIGFLPLANALTLLPYGEELVGIAQKPGEPLFHIRSNHISAKGVEPK